MSDSVGRTPLPPPLPEMERVPLVRNQRSLAWISESVARVSEGPTPRWWWIAFGISVTVMLLCFSMIAYLMSTGVGVWGVGHPVMWGWAIVNFVWWIGIGHAGTLISAILFLLRQRWRTAVNRAAEAMTLFAVLCAAIFPLIHVGRIWLVWWLFPIPNSNGMWPQFRSPLTWDVFAVSTYFTVSLLFWYMGLIPDLAVMRDRATTRIRKFAYGLFALGWRGSCRHWHNYEKAYLLLAGLATPLVLSVHSIVSLDFSVSQLPGWHSTLFPPYFVAGAIFSGLGMVLTLVIPIRKVCQWEDFITDRHVDLMCKVTLATGCMLAYAYGMELLAAWYSGNELERFSLWNRAFGPYAWSYWTMILCNLVLPQLFWFKRVRRNLLVVWLLSLAVNVGMWLERFVIVVTSLHREFLPSNWGLYSPTWVDVCTFIGTFGLFFTLFLLFMRFLPIISISEVKSIVPQADPCHPLGGRQAVRGEKALQANSSGVPMLEPTNTYGMAAEFETPAQALRAAERLRDAGFQNWDVYSPYPVRGMGGAMGLKNSKVGWFSCGGGAIGFAMGLGMVWFMNEFDYPILVGGKPLFSPLSAFPPAFELTILFGAFGALLGMLMVNKLPQLHHPLLKRRRFALASCDRFFVAVEASDPQYCEQRIRKLLEPLGSQNIERIAE